MLTANTTLTDVAVGTTAIVLAVMLATLGYRHFRDGIANDTAVPVPVYMISHVPMPKTAYVDAALALARADPDDGIATLHRAEALMHAGGHGSAIIAEINKGLNVAPASARGWTLLSEALYPVDKRAAAQALSQALILAPREYWLVGPQILDAARLWPYLGPDAQQAALAKARLLWKNIMLHEHLRAVVDTPDGASLVTRALSGDEIRAMNRWFSRERRRAPQP